MEVEARKDAKKYKMKEEEEMLEMRKKLNTFRKAEKDNKVIDVLSYSADIPHKSAQSPNNLIEIVVEEGGVVYNLRGDSSKKHKSFVDGTKLPDATTGGVVK